MNAEFAQDNSAFTFKNSFLGVLLQAAAAGLVFFSIFLPTGSVAGLPIKHFFYVSLVSLMFISWGRSNTSLPLRAVALLALTSVFTFVYMLLGLFRGVAYPAHILSESVGFFTTVSIVLLAWMCRSMGWVSARQFLIYAFFGSFCFVLLKSLAAILVSVGIISFPWLYGFVMDVFGYRFVSGLMFGELVRVNFIIYDFFSLLMLIMVISSPGLFDGVPRFFRYLFVAVSLVSIFFAYSRLLFGVLGLFLVFLFLFRFDWRKRVLLLAAVCAAAIVLFAWVEVIYQDRFKSQGAENSDRIRIEQVEALVDTWSDTPWIGGGFGFFARGHVRDFGVPYSYEVQWVGFLAKFGALGILFPFFLVVLIFLFGIRSARSPEALFVLFILLLFFLGGLTNQYLITSGAAVFYLSALFFFDSHFSLSNQARVAT